MDSSRYRVHLSSVLPRRSCYNWPSPVIYIDLKDIINKVEINLEIGTKLIIGIDTLLDVVSITL